MFKRLLLIYFFSQIIFLETQTFATVTGVALGTGACTVASFISRVFPSKEQQLRIKKAQQGIDTLKAVEDLFSCLIDNAKSKEYINELPRECFDCAKLIMELGEYELLHTTKIQFSQAVKELETKNQVNQGMSTSTKILIGGGVTLVIVGGVVVAIPILYPTSVAAVKIVAIAAKAKAAVASAAVATKGSVASIASTAAHPTALVKVVGAMTTGEKVMLAANVVTNSASTYATYSICQSTPLTEEMKLASLEREFTAKGSFAERMQKSYQ